MKNGLLLLMICVNSLIFGQTSTGSIKYGNYELVISSDKLSWNDANLTCKKMGDGWFVPSKRQMLILAKALKFDSGKQFFWTSEEGVFNAENYLGKVWNNGDYNAAEVIDVISKTSANFDVKSKLYYFVSIKSLGTNLQNCISNSNNSVKIGYMDVLTTSLYNINFYEAKNSLNSIGNGWRLPTKAELQLLFASKSILSINDNTLDLPIYWSSENSYGDTKSAWVKNFSNGSDGSMDTYSKARAILVKGDPNSSVSNSVQYESYKVGALEVMKFDLTNPINNSAEISYEDALKIVKNLGKGWRFPTIEELKLIYDNKSLGGNTFFNKEYQLWKTYWSSSNQNSLKFPGTNAEYGYTTSIWIMDFGNGKCYEASGSRNTFFRAVR